MLNIQSAPQRLLPKEEVGFLYSIVNHQVPFLKESDIFSYKMPVEYPSNGYLGALERVETKGKLDIKVLNSLKIKNESIGEFAQKHYESLIDEFFINMHDITYLDQFIQSEIIKQRKTTDITNIVLENCLKRAYMIQTSELYIELIKPSNKGLEVEDFNDDIELPCTDFMKERPEQNQMPRIDFLRMLKGEYKIHDRLTIQSEL